MYDFVLVSRREKEREREELWGLTPGSEGGRGLGWVGCGGGGVCDKHMPG